MTGSDNWLVVAELGRAHGIRGEVMARLRGVDAETLASLPDLRLVEAEGKERRIRVTRVRSKNDGWILSLEGVQDRNTAETLRGAELKAERSELPEPDDDEWYIADLVGMNVVTEDGREVGRLEQVLQLPANDVFVVQGDAGEVLLPVIDDVIVDVDAEEGKVIVHLLPGLLDEPEEEA
ncbi:MAG: 16S rRNA processing protein RimM [Gemmatimonadetes bacterium]|nr:16S rRNA processing protein RimM [Gemmatimonadota bacterium]